MKYIVCHYSEIALKGRNRKFFEERMIKNIKRVLDATLFFSVKRISGRIIIELTGKGKKKKEEIKEMLKFVFGISGFSFCVNVPQNITSIEEKVFEILKKEKFKTFKISSKRSDKFFPLSSRQLNEKLGGYVLNNMKNVTVDLTHPDIVCFVEIVEKYAFIFTQKNKGSGGLPSGSGGKAISLLSGGIDSPVASFETMRRGVELVFIHFHSYPETPQASIDKVRELVEILSRYQGKSKLYLSPISDLQREIVLKGSEKLRVILYRRAMLGIAKEIAQKEKAQVLVTGDSIGQVASQTIENIRAVESGLNMPIIRPLACRDKESIVKEAERIGTFDISILPHNDCCSRFLPRSPETRANLKEVLEQDEKVGIKKLIQKAVEKTTCEKIYGLELGK